MYNQLPLLALAASAVARPPYYGHGSPSNDDLTVKTTTGRVHGKIDSAQPNVRQFLGIPFAKPPLGDLRWAPPQSYSQPDAEIEATKLGPSCMQFLNTNSSSVYTDQVLEYNLQGLNRTGDISEDCLKLSVWTPTQDGHRGRKGRGKGRGKGKGRAGKDEGLPVLIYFYGGGFCEFCGISHLEGLLTMTSHWWYGCASADTHTMGAAHTRSHRAVLQLPCQHLRTP